jgi:hypothetical protein
VRGGIVDIHKSDCAVDADVPDPASVKELGWHHARAEQRVVLRVRGLGEKVIDQLEQPGSFTVVGYHLAECCLGARRAVHG